MKLFKITAKKTGSWSGGVKLVAGMSVEVVDNNNPLSTSSGKEKFKDAFENKYGIDVKQFASSSYFDVEVIGK